MQKFPQNLSLDESSTQFDITSNGTASSTSTLTEDDDEDCSIGGGVWVEPGREDVKHQADKTKHRIFTAFDPQGVGHRQISTELGSPESIHSGWEAWGIAPASMETRRNILRTGTAQNPRRNNKWEKIPVSCPYDTPYARYSSNTR
jgi:hypothetical protein